MTKRGMSIRDKVTAYDGLKRENDLLNLYLYDMAVHKRTPDATEKFDNKNKVDRVTGRVDLYRATAPHGGYIVISGMSNADIVYLEDAYRVYCVDHTTAMTEALVEAIRELYHIRNMLVKATAGTK